MSRRLRRCAGFVVGLIALAGCGFHGASSLPLPGGAAHGDTYHVTAIFDDVQDLTVRAAVRVNDVAVGDVTSISLGTTDLKAHVGMSINSSVVLPRNAVATLEQTTLLGEKFVAIEPPTAVAPVGKLVDDDTITSASSSDLPSVEEVFGLLSQVLNGGDLADLQTINVEISKALAGRETEVRGALTQLNTFVGGLNHSKRQIVRALVELDRFSSGLAAQDKTIATALTDIGPGLRVLADERGQFTALLADLSQLGKVATHVITASRSQTISALRDLQPILHRLSAAGSALPRSLEILATFPFPRDASQGAPGDYVNFAATADLSPIICEALANLSPSQLAALTTSQNNLIKSLKGDHVCPTAAKATSGAAAAGATPSPTPAQSSRALASLLAGGMGR